MIRKINTVRGTGIRIFKGDYIPFSILLKKENGADSPREALMLQCAPVPHLLQKCLRNRKNPGRSFKSL